MNKREVERLRKKVVRIEKSFNDLSDRLNKDITDLLTLLEPEDSPSAPPKSSKPRRPTPRRGGKGPLEDYDDNGDVSK